MIPIKERLESDVLIVGGGIAGLMAAIAAADKGASVILLDKANTKRAVPASCREGTHRNPVQG